MTTAKRYSGWLFTPDDILEIRHLIDTNPNAHRTALSVMVCEHFSWRKSNGGVKDMSCRVAMLRMEKDGLIKLPAPLRKPAPCRSYKKRTKKAEPQLLFSCLVHEISGVRLELVQKSQSGLWNEYIDRYHYLGYKPLPGAQLRYFAYGEDRILALFGFGAAAWKTAPRDEYIGWCRETRRQQLQYIVNNARFLILPWIQVKYLGSKLLSLVAKRIQDDWENRYSYRPVLLETFVDCERFKGTCYKAANWIYTGQTQGRGKLGDHRIGQIPKKSVWVYPLQKDFREQLRSPL